MARLVKESLLLSLFALVALSGHAQKYLVSIPHPKLAEGERVVGFEVHVDSGRIAAALNTPIGWSFSIDNDASWNTSLKALVTVGAAALDGKFFHKFVLVENQGLNAAPLSVGCDISVTKDFATSRIIHIPPKEVALEVVPDSSRSSSD